jgi:hypothetical protein
MDNPFGNGNIDLDLLLDLQNIDEKDNDKVFLTEKEKKQQRLLSMGIVPANKPKKNRRKKKRK